MRKIFYFLACMLVLQACIKKDTVLPDAPDDKRPLSIILQNNSNFSQFYDAMERAGLDSIISGKGSYTLLVPGNDVLQRNGFTTDSLQHMDPAALRGFLGHMILQGGITSDSVPQTIDYVYMNLAGDSMYFSVPIPGQFQYQATSGVLHVNGANAMKANIVASNGVIQSMDRVLQGPVSSVQAFLSNNPHYSWYVRALKNFGYWDSLDISGPQVILATSNETYMGHGLDSLAVEALDTLTYKRWLIGNTILRIGIFFNSDMQDAPTPPLYQPVVNPPVLITDDYVVVVQGTQIGLTPHNYIEIITTGEAPWYGYPYQWGGVVSLDADPDHLCRNGIVHGTTDLLAYPENLLK